MKMAGPIRVNPPWNPLWNARAQIPPALIRRPWLRGSELLIDTGRNHWVVTPTQLRREWPELYRSLRASGNRVAIQPSKPWYEFRSLEDYSYDSAAWENIMAMMATRGNALLAPYITNPPHLDLLLNEMLQHRFNPIAQAYLYDATIPLLGRVSELLEKNGGFWPPSNIVFQLIQKCQALVPSVARLGPGYIYDLIVCIDRISGQDHQTLINTLSMINDIQDLALLGQLCDEQALAKVYGGEGSTLAIRIGSLIYDLSWDAYAVDRGHV
ncbi:uncharacterized protein LY89DRAFT_83922 [Mollisia scopiformis]|uniref:Uncharacterized protein n=1 Tax=Mollisia scopiformis TaxID=149040 RepID=A0A194X9I1_MOLSC|nr:uncharacterized protein LY89DRAFT_83922 [Mollisia scopiformis]KUJ16432.1 hypothetical protein LY89DRAFT_83922 [Mollisia scopiformis]